MSQHALFSPSSAHKWLRCAGAIAMEHGLPSTTNRSAEEGTAAHELAALTLTDKAAYCAAYEGRVMSNGWEVSEEMCDYVQVYVDAIRDREAEYYQGGASNVTVLIESKVEFSDLVGVENQFGTSDAIFLVEYPNGTALIGVEDLKYGYHIVSAERNEQLMVYALAALETYGVVANFTRARMVIHQPRRNHVSDWEISVEDLKQFGAIVTEEAIVAHDLLERKLSNTLKPGELMESLTPGEKQCNFCKRNGDCPALQKWSEDTMQLDFDDLTPENVAESLKSIEVLEDNDRALRLSKLLRAMPLLETFAKGILTAAEAFMFEGGKVPGYKIVPGKKGHRRFRDVKEAEFTMKSMRLKQEEMYSFKIKSPAQLEKILKKNSPRRWKRLEDLIVQNEGQPSVAEEADPRNALDITSYNDFDALSGDEDFA